MKRNEMKYSVKTLRDAGLEAKWTRNRNGAPIIVARDPMATTEHQRTTWWHVGRDMWGTMQRNGIAEGFYRHTLLGNFFSVSV